ncbi:hypothetical protein GCM10022254_30970 [Actinomadura meridiana]|uniref:Uncharacterized protein n=1 Tax=Actinomadura meridiana TaxID=559626 RepID=A0ABP8C273_9ACTN
MVTDWRAQACHVPDQYLITDAGLVHKGNRVKQSRSFLKTRDAVTRMRVRPRDSADAEHLSPTLTRFMEANGIPWRSYVEVARVVADRSKRST